MEMELELELGAGTGTGTGTGTDTDTDTGIIATPLPNVRCYGGGIAISADSTACTYMR